MAEDCPEYFNFEVDNTLKKVKKTSEFSAIDDFKVLEDDSIRVNVIGYKSVDSDSEDGIDIAYKSVVKRFSVDKDNKIFRVEHYKNNNFCSMNMVHFK
jgi:hypothetical protein